MLSNDTVSKTVGGERRTITRGHGTRRRRYVLPAILCLTSVLICGLAASTAGAAVWPPTGPASSVAKPWWYSLPGVSSVKWPTSTPVSWPSIPGSSGSSGVAKTFSGTFTNSSGSITYKGYVPSSYKSGTAVPLVVALHGCTQSADDFSTLTGWNTLAAQKGFIVVYPEQNTNNNQLKCWNFFQPAHMQRGSGEPSLIAGITNWVQQHYTVDAHRVYVNGLSAGGAMSSIRAATYPDIYAAAGVGSGGEYAATAACAGSKSADPVQAGNQAYQAMGQYHRPIPLIAFQGDQDTTVPPINAQQLVQQWLLTDDMADDGAANGSIPSASSGVTSGRSAAGSNYTTTSFSDGHGGELIQSWLVAGMGHAWSGGPSSAQYSYPSGPDETAAMFAFFTAHPMP
jgi:poly(hydroxyalkanoate) depolymerase family esterase